MGADAGRLVVQPSVKPDDKPGQHRKADAQQDVPDGARQVMEHVGAGLSSGNPALASWIGT